MRLWHMALAAVLTLAAQTAQAAPQKYTWDGLGNGDAKCGIYRMHIEFTVDNGRASGMFQQKGRTMRNFDLPVGADGKFAGQVAVSGGTMRLNGVIGTSSELKLTGYCNFGGALKSA
ncbi:MAG: hypothetical protein ABI439_14385 [Rhodospirillales bacterium]